MVIYYNIKPLQVIVFPETPRTLLREITLDDLYGFYELESDPEVHKYLGTIPIVSKEKIEDIFISSGSNT